MPHGTLAPLRVLHLANHKSTNIGNGALIEHADDAHPWQLHPEKLNIAVSNYGKRRNAFSPTRRPRERT